MDKHGNNRKHNMNDHLKEKRNDIREDNFQ